MNESLLRIFVHRSKCSKNWEACKNVYLTNRIVLSPHISLGNERKDEIRAAQHGDGFSPR